MAEPRGFWLIKTLIIELLGEPRIIILLLLIIIIISAGTPLVSQGQLLEGVECHIYLYCSTFDDINLNRALVIIVLFRTTYSNKKVCANDIRK